MTQPNSNTPPKTSFGHLIRAAREAAGLSLRDVAAEADVSKSMLGKLEQDEIQSPNPRLLEALAPTLGIELIDLYSAAGYVPAKGLPNFSPYLRSKYRDLPQKHGPRLKRRSPRLPAATASLNAARHLAKTNKRRTAKERRLLMNHSTTRPTSYVSILKRVRALAPVRDCTFAESLVIAERQATRLAALLTGDARSTDGIQTHHIDGLPRIRVVFEAALPVSGMSHWNGQEWVVTIAGRDSLARQRFTMLHEFKHVIDHGATKRLYQSTKSRPPDSKPKWPPITSLAAHWSASATSNMHGAVASSDRPTWLPTSTSANPPSASDWRKPASMSSLIANRLADALDQFERQGTKRRSSATHHLTEGVTHEHSRNRDRHLADGCCLSARQHQGASRARR
ncbi:XRE family transcriptional regulator [Ornithinimicrobium sp. INDO-MA30-4]|uniref:XRE family transcriptional regulator n=1 Tax=Ornithinimicrobium sp. INDO-MA30-4 TaxID=2908651 RepID=UPI001F2DD38B|nr:XRE family transcriptional regulator [Ornithinimicrobium sp. INDO-MA30-4]UJH70456.1 XRE family transcriptional regulator [Ornithinimicrobium sp. INDO-MA30-4]